jgi:hypothetical protein
MRADFAICREGRGGFPQCKALDELKRRRQNAAALVLICTHPPFQFRKPAHGYAARIEPVLVLHLILLPVNLLRLAEVVPSIARCAALRRRRSAQ